MEKKAALDNAGQTKSDKDADGGSTAKKHFCVVPFTWWYFSGSKSYNGDWMLPHDSDEDSDNDNDDESEAEIEQNELISDTDDDEQEYEDGQLLLLLLQFLTLYAENFNKTVILPNTDLEISLLHSIKPLTCVLLQRSCQLTISKSVGIYLI